MTTAAAPSLKTRLLHAQTAWASRPKHERVFITLLVALFLITLFWFLIWLPVTRDLAAQNGNLPKARAALALTQQQFRETAGLSSAAIETPDALTATLNRFAARFGLASSLTGTQENNRQISFTISSVSMDTLTQFLDALAKEAALFPTSLSLTPLAENRNAVRAELTLAFPTP